MIIKKSKTYEDYSIYILTYFESLTLLILMNFINILEAMKTLSLVLIACQEIIFLSHHEQAISLLILG